jgi:hypothetical protein
MPHDPTTARHEPTDPATPAPDPDPSPSPGPMPGPPPEPWHDPGPPVRTVDLPPNQPSHGVPVESPEPQPF